MLKDFLLKMILQCTSCVKLMVFVFSTSLNKNEIREKKLNRRDISKSELTVFKFNVRPFSVNKLMLWIIHVRTDVY